MKLGAEGVGAVLRTAFGGSAIHEIILIRIDRLRKHEEKIEDRRSH